MTSATQVASESDGEKVNQLLHLSVVTAGVNGKLDEIDHISWLLDNAVVDLFQDRL